MCCTQLDKNPAYRALDRGDGTCRHFNSAERTCCVYADRPLLCRTDAVHSLYFSMLAPADFPRLNPSLCTQAQLAAGLPETYRLKQIA